MTIAMLTARRQAGWAGAFAVTGRTLVAIVVGNTAPP
jgi:hypothetical protein